MNTRSEVVKRDRSIVPYQPEKVRNAIKAAFISVHNEIDDLVLENIVDNITALFIKSNQIPVEVIQDEIENWLMHFHYFKVAKAFILYREKHKNIRNFAQKKISFINKYSQSNNTADATIDDNSNVSNHNIAVLNAEIHKEDNVSINLKILENKIKGAN